MKSNNNKYRPQINKRRKKNNREVKRGRSNDDVYKRSYKVAKKATGTCKAKQNCNGKPMRYQKSHLKYYISKFKHDGYCTTCSKQLMDIM